MYLGSLGKAIFCTDSVGYTVQDPNLLHNTGACTLVWISAILVYYSSVVMTLNDFTVCSWSHWVKIISTVLL